MEKFMLIFHGGSDIAPEMKNPEAMQKTHGKVVCLGGETEKRSSL